MRRILYYPDAWRSYLAAYKYLSAYKVWNQLYFWDIKQYVPRPLSVLLPPHFGVE